MTIQNSDSGVPMVRMSWEDRSESKRFNSILDHWGDRSVDTDTFARVHSESHARTVHPLDSRLENPWDASATL